MNLSDDDEMMDDANEIKLSLDALARPKPIDETTLRLAFEPPLPFEAPVASACALGASEDALVFLDAREGVAYAGAQRIDALAHVRIVQVAAGEAFFVLLDSSGVPYSMGDNRHGQLGRSTRDTHKAQPGAMKTLAGDAMADVVTVAAGARHALLLTGVGDVFACGDNAMGQLGVGDREARAACVRVARLHGVPVRQLAAGGTHSVALSTSGNVLAWGSNHFGEVSAAGGGGDGSVVAELADGRGSIVLLPSLVPSLKWRRVLFVAASYYYTCAVTATGSAVAWGKGYEGGVVVLAETGARALTARAHAPPLVLCDGDDALDVIGGFSESRRFARQYGVGTSAAHRLPPLATPLHTASPTAAAHASLLAAAYLTYDALGASEERAGVDVQKLLAANIDHRLLARLYASLLPRRESNKALRATDFVWSDDTLRLYFVGYVLADALLANGATCVRAFFSRRVPARLLRTLARWLELAPAVRFCHGAIACVGVADNATLTILEVLTVLHEVSPDQRELFYDETISRLPDAVLVQHYAACINDEASFTLLRYPWLFDEAAKTRLLRIDAGASREWGTCEVTVRRAALLADAVKQLRVVRRQQLRRRLVVRFVGEEAVDEGGVTKEFVRLLAAEVFSVDYGLFVGEKTLYFQRDFELPEQDVYYWLAGVIVGLALLYEVNLDLSFPFALLLREPERRDFKDVFDMSVPEHYVEGVDVTLRSGVDVDDRNWDAYVRELIETTFATTTRLAPMRDGFREVIGRGLIDRLCAPDELSRLIRGLERPLDVDRLRRGARYDGGYTAQSATIGAFWRVLRRIDGRRFLRFVTGSDRLPVRGEDGVRLVIQRAGGGKQFLPSASTCYNVLLLPEYDSEGELERKLRQAIEEGGEGFGLV